MLEKEKIDEIDVQVYKCKEDKNEIDNLYKTIYPEMCDYAKICANKYKNLNLDQEDFLYCFYFKYYYKSIRKKFIKKCKK